MSNHSIIVNDQDSKYERILALHTKDLFQVQVSQGGSDAFINLSIDEAIKFTEKLHEKLGRYSPFTKVIDKVSKYDWRNLEINKPFCIESGEWDGLRSSELLCRTANDEYYVGMAYKNEDDFEFYTTVDEFIISNVIEWMEVPL